MAASRNPAPGSRTGIPGRDRLELRALLQERVHEFTEQRRKNDLDMIAQLRADGKLDDAAKMEASCQLIIDEYDPVVALALVAVDRRSPIELQVRCNAEVAQYVRPKLKSIELQQDPDTAEMLSERQRTTENLVKLLADAAAARKAESAAAKKEGAS